MINKYLITFALLLHNNSKPLNIVDFEASVGTKINSITHPDLTHSTTQNNFFLSKDETINRATLFKTQFDSTIKNTSNITTNSLLIPKIIHQIWVGQNPLPQNLTFAINSIKKHHPDWKYMLWTESKIKELNSKFPHITLNQSVNPGRRSDVLRLEILNKFGGVYLDTDYFCCKPLDSLHKQFNFYCCILSKNYDIANGVMACSPQHPLVQQCISNLKINFKTSIDNIMHSTGPYFFTNQVVKFLKNKYDTSKTIILPKSYFHPLGGEYREGFWQNKIYFDFIRKHEKPETYAIHLFACSWQKQMMTVNISKMLQQYHLLFTKGNNVINAQRSKDRATPLIVAAKHNLTKTIDILCRFGANTKIKDIHNLTALDYASGKNKKIIESYL